MTILKDVAPLVISSFALGISLYNFYTQQFRKRDALIGHLIEVSVNEGQFSSRAEYSVANIGDTQLLVKEVQVLGSGGAVIKSESTKVPVVLKPGEIAVLDVMYNNDEIRERLDDEEICLIELGILSPNGVGYRLPHRFRGKGITHESKWEVFRLQREHAGF